MTRRQTLQACGVSAILLATVPGLALLCRGHSPSRFAPANLPVWERTVPSPVPWRAALRGKPLPPGAVQFSRPFVASQMSAVNPDPMFGALEHPSPRRPSPSGAGRPGVWLQNACALGRGDASLRRAQDEIALRLMNAQDADGYLAAGTKAGRWSPAQAQAFRDNLQGLLAYYALTRSPAAIYAAMQAGDLVVNESASVPNAASCKNALLLPMAALYHWTGEPKYKAWAVREAAAGTTDGAGLCALYRLTGRKPYLQAAQRLWKTGRAAGSRDPEFASALWSVTGAPGYLTMLQTASAPWTNPLAPGSDAYGRVPDGLAVNVYANSRGDFGLVRLTQRVTTAPGRPPLATLIVDAPRPIAFALHLAVPVSSAVSVNGKPLPTGTASGAVIVKRFWTAGDKITVFVPPPTSPSHS